MSHFLAPAQGERAHVTFISSADPLPKPVGVETGIDTIRVFWGGGDGFVGTGTISVTVDLFNEELSK